MLVASTVLCLLVFCAESNARPKNGDSSFDLSVIHINDFHARFEETNNDGGKCKSEECIGGFSRMYTVVNESYAQNPDSLLLNAGDNFQGTLWYNIFKWNVIQYFVNKLPFDAITLGNHEFDDGIAGVVPFIKSLKAPVVLSNIDDTLEPDIQNTYRKSVVVERNGKKIGIVGVILRTTNEVSKTDNLQFLDELESVNAEAERLVREEHVFTNIVLSHSGYRLEQKIGQKATAASKIGLIVGGHSHSFLYTGDSVPGPLSPAGPYPTVVKRSEDGQQVLVVQASSYARYLGKITISYDGEGNSIGWSGSPIFLGKDVPQDEEINKEMAPWQETVAKEGNRVIGNTLVDLDRSTCKYSECTLGNFVADAMVYSYTNSTNDSSWTYASLAVINVGTLRTSIEKGNITYGDMMCAQPFENTFDVGEIEGQYIKEMFEFSVTPYVHKKSWINLHLLQVSGFRIVADLAQPIGSRLTSIKVRCQECKDPIYEDLDLEKTYRLIVPSFLKTGGDGFVAISNNLKNIRVGKLDIDVFVDYLEQMSPISVEIEGRIEITDTNRK